MFLALALLIFGLPAFSADIPKMPVPNSPYIAVVYRYADTMLEKARDTFGPQPTGTFLSALDRTTLAPLTSRPTAPRGVREDERDASKDGPLTGANPHHDENLLRLLYTLSELSAKPKYRDAADAELKWFLQSAASPDTHLLPWGEHMSWDVIKDERIAADGSETGTHGFFRPWMLWDRCFELAPEPSRKFALALWDHQIANHETGAFDPSAGFSKHRTKEGMDFPRHAGFFIRTWAVAYAHTKDEQFLKAITVLLERFEKKRDVKTGMIEAHTGNPNAWVTSTLSLAIDCDGASHRVPEPLASRLRVFATREDALFCALPHDVKNTGGFLTSVDRVSGEPNNRRTPLWNPRYGGKTTARVAMMCVSRYDNTGNIGYRDLLHAAADAYLTSMPAEDDDAWPATFGHAICLQLAAWRSTARQVYFDRARQLSDAAIEKFFEKNPLPRASLKSSHYESLTGAATLALALLELHLQVLHITAVRCPPNTIDR